MSIDTLLLFLIFLCLVFPSATGYLRKISDTLNELNDKIEEPEGEEDDA